MNRSKIRVESPCVGNCCLDGNDVCLGCFRHVEEIKSWAAAADKERLSIIQMAKRRRDKREEKSLFY